MALDSMYKFKEIKKITEEKKEPSVTLNMNWILIFHNNRQAKGHRLTTAGAFCFAHYIAGDPSGQPGTSAISFARSLAGVLVKTDER